MPDLPANADEALGVAHLAALRGLVGKDSDPTTAYEVSEAIKAAETSTAGARK